MAYRRGQTAFAFVEMLSQPVKLVQRIQWSGGVAWAVETVYHRWSEGLIGPADERLMLVQEERLCLRKNIKTGYALAIKKRWVKSNSDYIHVFMMAHAFSKTRQHPDDWSRDIRKMNETLG